MDKNSKDTLLNSLILELRRGTIIISVMSCLKTPQYGYSLVIMLEGKGTSVDAGTLYPLLRRLESQGLLQSSWDVESAKPRKYYQLSDEGKDIYTKLCTHWKEIADNLNALINEKGM